MKLRFALSFYFFLRAALVSCEADYSGPPVEMNEEGRRIYEKNRDLAPRVAKGLQVAVAELIGGILQTVGKTGNALTDVATDVAGSTGRHVAAPIVGTGTVRGVGKLGSIVKDGADVLLKKADKLGNRMTTNAEHEKFSLGVRRLIREKKHEDRKMAKKLRKLQEEAIAEQMSKGYFEIPPINYPAKYEGAHTAAGIQSNVHPNVGSAVLPNVGVQPSVGVHPNVESAVLPNVGVQPSVGSAVLPNVGVQPSVSVHPNAGYAVLPNVGVQPSVGVHPNVGVQPNMGAQPNVGIHPNMDLLQNVAFHPIYTQHPYYVKDSAGMSSEETTMSDDSGRGYRPQFYHGGIPQNLAVIPNSYVPSHRIPQNQQIPQQMYHQIPQVNHQNPYYAAEQQEANRDVRRVPMSVRPLFQNEMLPQPPTKSTIVAEPPPELQKQRLEEKPVILRENPAAAQEKPTVTQNKPVVVPEKPSAAVASQEKSATTASSKGISPPPATLERQPRIADAIAKNEAPAASSPPLPPPPPPLPKPKESLQFKKRQE